MLVSLYTSRIVLQSLGVEDFGLYSIIGGIVSFCGFINTSMASASQRFLSFAQGKDSAEYAINTFNSVLRAQIIIAILVFLAAETIGVYYIQYHLNCDQTKIIYAHIVFQFSLLALITKTVSVPYVASIIAHERMNVFALLSLMESILMLTVAYYLPLFDSNRLLIYAGGNSFTIFCVQLGYRIYCQRHFKECKIINKTDKHQITQIFKYSSWNLLGALSSVGIEQGVNLVLNSFFGVVVNAARGIAYQVSIAVTSLTNNFQQALNPQIVKSYAQNDIEKMLAFIVNGTKFSVFLLLIIAFPVFCNIQEILAIWLTDVPEYTAIFCRLILVNCLINSFSSCILTGVLATGNIRVYQLIVASINLLNIPISLIVLYFYPIPYYTAIVMIVISITAFFARLFIASRLLHFSKSGFLKRIFYHIAIVFFVVFSLGYQLDNLVLFDSMIYNLIIKILYCIVLCILSIYLFGLNKQEKHLLLKFLRKQNK